jgi:hypothetical protein
MKKLPVALILGLLAATPLAAGAMPDMSDLADMAGEKIPGAKNIVGKVVETMDSSGYTYILLDSKGEKVWVAVPQMYVTVGEEMELEGGTQMGEFVSKPLNRTFDKIIFSGGPTEKFNEERKKKAHSGVVTGETKVQETKQEGKVVPNLKVEKAAGANAYTVAEIYKKRADLADKNIIVRGQVVKVSTGIMDRNWVHLEDGSGEAGKGNGKLVVTTKDRPALGDVVTASGVMHKNKDFGGGYKYDVILEDASLKK